MKTKKKLRENATVWLMVVAMVMCGFGSYAQSNLSISGGVATVTADGSYNIPSSGISPVGQTTNRFRLDVVLEKATPANVKIGAPSLTNIGRSYPIGHGGGLTESYASVSLPGAYAILGNEGDATYDVRFISDPILTIGGTSKNVSAWGSGPINVPSGASVSLAVPVQLTASGIGSNRCEYYAGGTWLEIGRNLPNYPLTGAGSVDYRLRTEDSSPNSLNSVQFTLVYASVTQYTIVASAGSNGSIAPSGNVSVTAGGNQSFTFTPNSGYEVDQVTVDGVVTSVSGNSYQFTNVNSNRTIHVTFKMSTIAVTGVTLDQTSLTKTVGDPAVTLVATVAPNTATNKNVSWSTSNASVATVSNGTVNFVGPGNAVITVTTQDGNKTATCNVTVNAATPTVTSVTVNGPSSVQKGQQGNYTATVTGTNNPGQGVTWSVEGASASSINSSGVLTVGAGETANSLTVRATSSVDPSKSGTATVTLTAAAPTVTSVTVNGPSSVQKGQQGNYTATVIGTNNPGQGVTWSVEGASASSINSLGVLTVGAGETANSLTVRATSSVDPSKSGTATVTLTAAAPTVTSVTVNGPSSVQKGQQGNYTATVTGTNNPGQGVTWSVEGASASSINSLGVLTVGAGETANSLTVRATSSVDPSKSGTMSVTVTSSTVAVTGVTLDPTGLVRTVADPAVTLTVTIQPATATNKNVTWSSNNPAVATVVNGVVNFVAQGSAIITVTTVDGGKTATCGVSVNAPSVVNAQNPNITAQPQGATYNQNASASPISVNANVADGGTLSYQWYVSTANNYSGSTIASATGSTYTPPTNTVGTLYYYVAVTNTNNNASVNKTATVISSTAPITINATTEPVTGVSLGILEKTLAPNESFQLTATVSPSNATNKNVTWSSDNASVATVSSTGLVTAKAVGETKVWATSVADPTKKDWVTIIVKSSTVSVTGITLNKSALSLEVGKTESLIATVTPANATNKGVVWTTSDASVVSIVNEKLTAVKVGTATITAKTQDGGFEAKCVVTVVAAPVPEHTVNISSNAGGVVSPTGSVRVTEGGNLTIMITPNVNYVIERITVDGTSVAVTNSLQLNNIRSNRTVVVTFKYDPVSNEDIQTSSLNVFSPEKGIIRLEAGECINHVKVYSLNGVLMNSVRVGGTEAVIRNVPKGICLVQVFVGAEVKVYKIAVR